MRVLKVMWVPPRSHKAGLPISESTVSTTPGYWKFSRGRKMQASTLLLVSVALKRIRHHLLSLPHSFQCQNPMGPSRFGPGTWREAQQSQEGDSSSTLHCLLCLKK